MSGHHTRRRASPFISRPTAHPDIKRFGDWPKCNQEFYERYYIWLRRGGYQWATRSRYGHTARVILGYLDKPYDQIDLDTDLARAWELVVKLTPNPKTLRMYQNGLEKFKQYLRQLRGQPERTPEFERQPHIHWERYGRSLPAGLVQLIQLYITHCERRWLPAERYQRSVEHVSKLTLIFRGLAAHCDLQELGHVTPPVWDDYVAARLEAGIKPTTVNSDLCYLQSFLRFLAEVDHPICQRILRVKHLRENERVPRDVPPEQLRRLLEEVEHATKDPNPTLRSFAVMDRAWILLMLHSGLRTCEIRHLKLGDIDWERRTVRIEQSKGLKDRLVPVSQAALDALRAYLTARGRVGPETDDIASNLVFIHWHAGLNQIHCRSRLSWYGKQCGVKITPHQLRHSAATLLLNAGAPVLSVQMILGHKKIDTTLDYARLYDGRIASDYYGAMAQVERQIALTEDASAQPPSPAEMLALVDALRGGTLNERQTEMVQSLRLGIATLSEQSAKGQPVSSP